MQKMKINTSSENTQCIKNLNIWYTNTNALTKKMVELEARIQATHSVNHPDIIAVTELKPKNFDLCYFEVDFILKGYTPHL